MADTSYLRTTVEEAVRRELTRIYKTTFSAKRVRLTTGGTHEFDAVSEDGSIIVGIKASGGLTAGGKIPAGKIKSAIAELYYLTLTTATTRCLVLTDKEFHAILRRRLEGALAPGLRLELVELPQSIQDQVRVVRSQASREVSPMRRTPEET